jgi:predicted transcriptional regulator
MASKSVTVRLDEGLLAWADRVAAEQGATRTDVLAAAVAAFREESEAGMPELREMAKRQAYVPSAPEALAALQGVGDCPDRPGELGHIWKSAKEDDRRSCRFCGMPGRDNLARRDAKGNLRPDEGGFFAQATAERVELFSRMRTPDSARGIKAKETTR